MGINWDSARAIIMVLGALLLILGGILTAHISLFWVTAGIVLIGTSCFGIPIGRKLYSNLFRDDPAHLRIDMPGFVHSTPVVVTGTADPGGATVIMRRRLPSSPFRVSPVLEQ